MPQKLNKAGKMQDYIPKGNGDASGEYGTSNGTNKNFTTSDKKSSKANVITENKSVVVENKGKSNSIEELKKQKDLAEKEMDKYVDYADKSWMPEYQDEEKRAKYYEAQRKFNELRKEINKLEDKKNAKNNNGMTEKVKGGADGNTILERTIKYSKMNLSDKEIVDRVVDELGIKEEKAKEYLETIKESRKQAKANIIDNDLTGKGKAKEINDFSKVFDNDDLTITFENDKYSYAKSGKDGMKKNQFLETLGATVSNKKQREHLATRNDGKWIFNVKNNKTGETKAITLNNDELFSLWNKVKNKGDLEKKGNNYFSVSFQKERQERNKKDFEDYD